MSESNKEVLAVMATTEDLLQYAELYNRADVNRIDMKMYRDTLLSIRNNLAEIITLPLSMSSIVRHKELCAQYELRLEEYLSAVRKPLEFPLSMTHNVKSKEQLLDERYVQQVKAISAQAKQLNTLYLKMTHEHIPNASDYLPIDSGCASIKINEPSDSNKYGNVEITFNASWLTFRMVVHSDPCLITNYYNTYINDTHYSIRKLMHHRFGHMPRLTNSFCTIEVVNLMQSIAENIIKIANELLNPEFING